MKSEREEFQDAVSAAVIKGLGPSRPSDLDKAAITVSPEPVKITCAELGQMFAEFAADDQVAVLLSMAHFASQFGWAMQCRAIVDLLPESDRSSIAQCLDTLVDHLREHSPPTFPIRVILTRNQMPDPHRIVIVAGGIACWTGSNWISYTHGHGHEDRRPITWPVLWWMPLLHDEDVLSVQERPHPPCSI